MSRSITRVDSTAEELHLAADERRVVGIRRVYDVEFADSTLRHHEKMYDVAGDLIYDQDVELQYVLGSGRLAKAFLHQRGNRLFLSPLNWYSTVGKWDYGPGHGNDDHRRFDRVANNECLSCHAGRVAVEPASSHTYETPAFHEMAIGCERCHGPGETHVAIQNMDERTGSMKDTIVHPGHLDRAQQESLCGQCHLGGTVRVLRNGRSDFDFRPGNVLEDIWTILNSDTGVGLDGRTRAINHVEQMRDSLCYKRSGRLSCTSCHNPHGIPAEAEHQEFYRDKCIECHASDACAAPLEQRAARGDACIDCHMPAREVRNVSHVTLTDHRMLRTIPRETTASGPALERLVVATDKTPIPSWEIDRAVGLAAWIHYVLRSGRRAPDALPELLAKALEHDSQDGTTLLALGSMARQNQRFALAITYLEAARNAPDANEVDVLEELLTLYYDTGQWEQAEKIARDLVVLHPSNARAHAILADVLRNLGDTPAGIESAKRALELNPTLIPVRHWLVEAYRRTGRQAEQQHEEQLILRLQDARLPVPAGDPPP